MSGIEDLVRDAFVAHESGAPDASGLLETVRERSARRRRRDWIAAGVAAAAVVALVVAVTITSPGGRHRIGPAISPSPSPTRTPRVKPPTAGMPGLVQVAASAFPTADHGVVFVQQCHPCQARGGTYTNWVAVTNNGGRSWTVRKTPLRLTVPNFGVVFADASNGWTESGYVTHDGGLTWQKAKIGTRWTVDGLSVAGGTVWAVAECAHGGCGTAVFSGPATGSTLTPAPRQPFSGYKPGWILGQGADTAYIPRQSGWFSGVVFATRDGGRSWKELRWPCPVGTYAAGLLAAGTSASLWQACNVAVKKPHLRKPAPGRTFLLARSNDGGLHWETRPNPMSVVELHPVSALVAWGWDDMGHASRTTDGGTTWQQVWPAASLATTGTPEAFSSQNALTAEITVAVSPATGTYLVVYRTHDGGHTWQPSVIALPAR